MVTIQIQNRVEEIRGLEDSLRRFFADNDLVEDELATIHLVLEELVSNVISYGYDDDRPHTIVIRVDLRDQDLRIEVEDDGRAFNPLEQPIPELADTLEEHRVGGLGLLLVRKLTDQLSYRREGGKNLLEMRKIGVKKNMT